MLKVMLLVSRVTTIQLFNSIQRPLISTHITSKYYSIVDLPTTNSDNSVWQSKTTPQRFQSTLRMLTLIITRAFHWIEEVTLMRPLSVSRLRLILNLVRPTFTIIEALLIVNNATSMQPSQITQELSNLTQITSRLTITGPFAGIKLIT